MPVSKSELKKSLKESELKDIEEYRTLLNRMLESSEDLDSTYRDVQLVYNGESIFDEQKLKEYGIDLEGANFLDMRSIMDNISLGFLGEYAENTRLFRFKSKYYRRQALSEAGAEQGITMQDASPSVINNQSAIELDKLNSDALDYAINTLFEENGWWKKLQQKEVHETQLHGLSFGVWEDKTDPTPTIYPRYRVKVSAKTKCDVNKWRAVAIESTYNVDELYQFYLNSTKKKTKADKAQGWQEDALAEFLYWHSKERRSPGYSSLQPGTPEFSETAVNFATRLRTGQSGLRENFNEEFILYNIFRRNIDGGISRVILDKNFTGSNFLYKKHNDRNSFSEIVFPFVRKPWLEYLLEQAGIGQDIFTFQQAIQEVMNYSLEGAKLASTIIINSPENSQGSAEPIDLIPGVAIDAGEHQISSSSIGVNLNAQISYLQFLQNKLTTNLITMGYNMNVNDLEFNNDKQLSMFALREARARKNIFSLYYQNLEEFMRVYFGKLIKNKQHEDYKKFAELMLEKGVNIKDKDSFLNEEKDKYGVPRSLRISVSKTHGSGSQFADQLMADKLMSVSGSYDAQGQQKVLELFTVANSTSEIADEVLFNLKQNQNKPPQWLVKESVRDANDIELGQSVPKLEDADSQTALIFADTMIKRITSIIQAIQEGAYGETKVYVSPEYQHLEGVPMETPFEQALEALMELYAHASFYVSKVVGSPINAQMGARFKATLGELLNPLKQIQARALQDAEGRQGVIEQRLQQASEVKFENEMERAKVLSKIQNEQAITQNKIKQRADMDNFNKQLKISNLLEKSEIERLKLSSDTQLKYQELRSNNILKQLENNKG